MEPERTHGLVSHISIIGHGGRTLACGNLHSTQGQSVAGLSIHSDWRPGTIHDKTFFPSRAHSRPSDPLRCVWFVSILLRVRATTGCSGWRSLSSYWYSWLEAACISSHCSPMFSPYTSTRPAQGTKFFGQRAVIDQVRSDAVLPRRNHRVTPRLVIFFLITKGLIDVITWQGTCSLSSLNPTASSSCGRQGCTKKLVLIP